MKAVPAEPPPQEGLAQLPGVSRRVFLLRAGTSALGAAGLGLGGYVVAWEPEQLVVERRRFALRGLPVELSGLRAVLLSDIHHGPWISLESVVAIVERVNALRPDLVLLTGDYVSQSGAFISPVAGALSRLRPKIATLAVLGNHDWWEGAGQMRDAFAKAGIRLVDNDRVLVGSERRLDSQARAGLCVAGVGDFWEDEIDVPKALGQLPGQMPRLVLSHNPDVAEIEDFEGERVDLMLSGHTHGGQARFPIVGTPVVPSNYGPKYASGLVQGPRFPVYVTRGTGMAVLPLRFCVRPEITLLELVPQEDTRGC